MRFIGRFLVVASLLLLSVVSCQATEKKDEWKDPNFNFLNIKTVVVTTAVDPKVELDEFSIRKLENLYSNGLFKNEKRREKGIFLFITQNQLKDRISKATGENMEQLEREDPLRYKAEMDNFTPIIADAILRIKVTSFGYDQRFVEESYYTYTEQVETEIDIDYQDSKGKWVHGKKTIKKPVERTVITPAHYDTYGNAGMDYILVDSKNKQSIWMLRDIREARGKEPIDMTERIINRAADLLFNL